MIGGAAHFALASWVLAGAFIAFTVMLIVAVGWSMHSNRQRSVGVIEAARALAAAGALTQSEALDVIRRYSSSRGVT